MKLKIIFNRKSHKLSNRLKSNICTKCGKPISYILTQMNVHLMNCKGK
jgi:hypothetical protein